MPLKDEIFEVLSKQGQTVAQLAERFGVTRNSIVVQLGRLESAGLVTRSTLHREGQVGKPAILYEAAAGHEDRNSSAYRAWSEMQARALGSFLRPDRRRKLYRQMGEAEGRAIDFSGLKSLEERLAATQAFADDLGAATSLEEGADSYMLRSFTCPIAAVVRIEPCACASLAALFEQLTGRPTRDRCLRGDKLVCQFEIEK
ncbi:MAG: helix-turn-helix domain-containing protein [Pseudomonadota bacterium]